MVPPIINVLEDAIKIGILLNLEEVPRSRLPSIGTVKEPSLYEYVRSTKTVVHRSRGKYVCHLQENTPEKGDVDMREYFLLDCNLALTQSQIAC